MLELAGEIGVGGRRLTRACADRNDRREQREGEPLTKSPHGPPFGRPPPRLPTISRKGARAHLAAASTCPPNDGPAPARQRRAATLLAIIATDRTFERATAGDREVWSGKCLHRNARLMIDLHGEPISRATIEHILPKNHGGTDDSPNLGIACARCNSEKGVRHDHKRRNDARLQEVSAAKLAEKRRERWRDPTPT